MKIGYPCINNSIDCTSNRTFRLRNYSEDRLIQIVHHNLTCLLNILRWNVKHGLLFFRFGSSVVPFASHPVCKFDWEKYFGRQLKLIGDYVKMHDIRISMHPDQFTLLNSPNKDITLRSVAELDYHCRLLDAMRLDSSAKVQIHVGGVYGDKKSAMDRFVHTYMKLPAHVKSRLVVENDDRLYSLQDCLGINRLTGVPILFDSFHHECLNGGEAMRDAVNLARKTWKKKDGVLMIDYSNQKPGARKGSHAFSINMPHFKRFIKKIRGVDCDIMLEIKDKEKSALKVVDVL